MPMAIDSLLDQKAKSLPGGELQWIALALALRKPADICLIDEAPAHFDSKRRIAAAKMIKLYALHAKKAGPSS